MNKYFNYYMILFCLLFMICNKSQTQSLHQSVNLKYGSMCGIIIDSIKNETLISVNCILLSNGKYTHYGAASDKDGKYLIQFISPGYYSLKVSFVGYTPKIIDSIEILPDQQTKVDVYLIDSGISWGLEDLANGNIVLVYGGQFIEPFPDSSFTDKYGFRYEQIAGSCDEEAHNRVIESYLDKRNGKGWEEKVMSEWKTYRADLMAQWAQGIRWVSNLNKDKSDTLIWYADYSYKYYHCEINNWSFGEISRMKDTILLEEKQIISKISNRNRTLFIYDSNFDKLTAIPEKNYFLFSLTKFR